MKWTTKIWIRTREREGAAFGPWYEVNDKNTNRRFMLGLLIERAEWTITMNGPGGLAYEYCCSEQEPAV
jgi:hypothetical protein